MASVENEVSASLISGRLLFRVTAVIGLLAALTAGLILFGKHLGDELALGGNTDSTEIHHVLIGQDALALPANTIRFERQRYSGRAESLSVYLSWPALEGYSRQTAGVFSDPRRVDGLVFIDFSQSVMSRDMSGRVEPIYSRLFTGAPTDGPAGLKIHALTRNSGFGEEKLLTARLPDGTIYAVRCLLPADINASTSADCLRDVRVGRDLTMLYRFSAVLLPQWQEIEKAMHNFAEAHIVR